MSLSCNQDQSAYEQGIVPNFHQQVLDSMIEHVAILDKEGRIILVNEAWKRFARENGDPNLVSTGIGANYLDICRRAVNESKAAREVLYGISSILEGLVDWFALEYSCHSHDCMRWFLLNATPLKREQGGVMLAHLDITARKLAEQEREQLVAQLAHAQAVIKTLSGLIPVCGDCGGIRNDPPYWEQLQTFLAEGRNDILAFGLCPECQKEDLT